MRTGHAARKFWRSTLPGFLIAAQFALPAQAGQVAIATSPLFNAAISLVKPNLLFILDDSSSMDYNYLPDEVPWDIVDLANPSPQTDSHAVALTSAHCSGVAYDPTVTYSPPVDANGNPFINASGTSSNLALYPSVTLAAAPNNGFEPGSATTVLTNQFYYKYTGLQPALAYTYVGGAVDVTTTFYKECNSPVANAPKFSKVTVTAGSAERQNYANWWSYYRKRLLMMKTITGKSFQTLDSKFRVGFSTAHDTQADDRPTFLPIDDFASGVGSQKEKFYTKLYGITASVVSPTMFTPSRGALSKAGRLFAGKFFTGGVFPGASTADKLRDPMQYSCQQNFAVLASDGYWNALDDNGMGGASNFGPFGLDNVTPVGNQDGGGTAPPMYEGNYPGGATAPNSLADVSMYYYQTDLRFHGDFNENSCKSGSTGANLCPVDTQDPPQYAPNVPTTLVDNNRKPHMTTLTVGLAINGLLGYSPTYQSDQTGDFHSISQGNLNWPHPSSTTGPFPYATTSTQVIERVDDLWHAAVNGRGTYFNANNPTTLVSALTAALGGVASRLGYTAGATSSLAPIAGNNALFVASYITGQWTGNVQSQSIDPITGQVITTPTWCAEPITGVCDGKLETQVHPSSDDRTIYFNRISTGGLDSFTYGNLSLAQQAYFNPNQLSQYASWSAGDKTVGTASTLVDYLRGQSQYEIQDTNTNKLYRFRLARLGDIVDTAPLYLGAPFYQFVDPGYSAFKTAKAGRAKTVFVSGNDGMLHAFNAVSGLERWAFVPTVVMPNMYRLADAGYAGNHRNYVNGRLVWSDVCFANCTDPATADWRTILMGGLGGGGRSYYALDVTNPASPSLLWEFTAAADANHVDIGYSFGNPLAVKKPDGTWVVAVASGYDNGSKDSDGNSYAAGLAGSGLGVLYLLNPQTGAVVAKYQTTAGTAAAPSGLARMSYWADNPEQNATALYGYGGDLAGNFWRFDFSKAPGATDAVVKLATFQNGGPSPQPQPITTRPEMTKLGSDRLIFVATGKYLEQSDLTNKQTQSLYAIIDKGTGCSSSPPPCTVSDRTVLAQRTLVDNPSAGTRTVTEANGNDPANGWFIDFPDLGTGGGSERVNVDMVLVVGTLVVPTNVPTDQICNASGFSWINFLDFKTGEAVGGNPTSSVATLFGNDMTTGINAIWIAGTPEVIRTGNATGPTRVGGITFANVGASVTGHRVGWREIFVK